MTGPTVGETGRTATPRGRRPSTDRRSRCTHRVLKDAFERVRDAVHPAVNGLTVEELAFRPDAESNSIAWLVWHLTRIQDDHVAGAGRRRRRCGRRRAGPTGSALPFDPSDTGYGHDADAVAAVPADAASLLGYFEDVHTATVAYLATLDDDDLDRVVDRNWDPPVTVGRAAGERHRRRPPARRARPPTCGASCSDADGSSGGPARAGTLHRAFKFPPDHAETQGPSVRARRDEGRCPTRQADHEPDELEPAPRRARSTGRRAVASTPPRSAT